MSFIKMSHGIKRQVLNVEAMKEYAVPVPAVYCNETCQLPEDGQELWPKHVAAVVVDEQISHLSMCINK